MIGEMENETRKGTREWRDGRRSIRRTGYRIGRKGRWST